MNIFIVSFEDDSEQRKDPLYRPRLVALESLFRQSMN